MCPQTPVCRRPPQNGEAILFHWSNAFFCWYFGVSKKVQLASRRVFVHCLENHCKPDTSCSPSVPDIKIAIYLAAALCTQFRKVAWRLGQRSNVQFRVKEEGTLSVNFCGLTFPPAVQVPEGSSGCEGRRLRQFGIIQLVCSVVAERGLPDPAPRYRTQDNVNPPFRILSPVLRELGKTRLEVCPEFWIENPAPLPWLCSSQVHNLHPVLARIRNSESPFFCWRNYVVFPPPTRSEYLMSQNDHLLATVGLTPPTPLHSNSDSSSLFFKLHSFSLISF